LALLTPGVKSCVKKVTLPRESYVQTMFGINSIIILFIFG
jgi:hypothetical protein